MNRSAGVMVLVAFALMIIAYIKGGFSLFVQGLIGGGETLLSITPLLVIAFTVAGFVSILISRDQVSKWLGKEAGWKGPFLGALIGAMVPGGPFFFYPLMATLIASGANVGTMISFVAAKTLWYIGRIPVEIAFVGLEVTAIRFLITFMIPVIAGGAVNLFFPGYSDKIREEVDERQKCFALKGLRGGGEND